jgi:UDP-glucose 4-epimerase
VTLLDAMVDDHGGNLFNVEPVRDRVTINFSDIRNESSLKYLVTGKDYVFHLAGQNDHVLSLRDPFPDIDINIKGSAMLLETCRRFNRSARLVYGGTRGEYGPAVMLPVAEDHPMRPRGIYELSSLTAQQLFQIYHDNHGVASVTLRLTNIYGERAQMKHSRFGVANWFVRQALDDATIHVFGDGSLLRDFVYVQDAVEAMVRCAATEEAYGQVFNVGNNRASSFRELAETVVRVAESGRWELAPFSPERAAQEPGDFCSDIRKIKRVVGWEPTTRLDDGVASTVGYYRLHRHRYW